MNTILFSLRRLMIGSWLVTCLMLVGCDYGHPFSEPSGEPINSALLGSWVETTSMEGKTPATLEVQAVSEAEFLVKYSGHTFRARRVKETPAHFLQLQLPVPKPGEPSTRTYVFCFFKFSGTELVVNRVSEPDEQSARPETAETVRAWVGRALAGEPFSAHVYRFRRK